MGMLLVPGRTDLFTIFSTTSYDTRCRVVYITKEMWDLPCEHVPNILFISGLPRNLKELVLGGQCYWAVQLICTIDLVAQMGEMLVHLFVDRMYTSFLCDGQQAVPATTRL